MEKDCPHSSPSHRLDQALLIRALTEPVWKARLTLGSASDASPAQKERHRHVGLDDHRMFDRSRPPPRPGHVRGRPPCGRHCRIADDVADLVEAYPGSALGLQLDVTDDDHEGDAVRRATEHLGQFHVLVNNAGDGYPAAVEEGEVDVVAKLFDANFFGTVALIKAVLPGPGDAVEGISASLRKELQPLGIATHGPNPAIPPGPRWR